MTDAILMGNTATLAIGMDLLHHSNRRLAVGSSFS